MKPMSPEHEAVLLKSVEETVQMAEDKRLEEIKKRYDWHNIALSGEDEYRDLGYLIDRVEKLERVRSAAASLMSEDDAQEALSHYVVLQILRDALDACDEPSSRATGYGIEE